MTSGRQSSASKANWRRWRSSFSVSKLLRNRIPGMRMREVSASSVSNTKSHNSGAGATADASSKIPRINDARCASTELLAWRRSMTREQHGDEDDEQSFSLRADYHRYDGVRRTGSDGAGSITIDKTTATVLGAIGSAAIRLP